MEAERRRKTRKPLSDRTNTTSSSAPRNLLKLKSKLCDESDNVSIGSNSNNTLNNCENAPNPSSVFSLPLASTPSRPLNSASVSVSGNGDHEVFDSHTVYSRRQTEDKRTGKRKKNHTPLSCSTLVRIRHSGGNLEEDKTVRVSKLSSAPPKKKQRQKLHEEDGSEHAVPQDFIDQQRAYFAEIDAFELPEEEVESLNKLD